MLSRVAESLFWIGRLVERAEDVARMLEVSVNLLLEESSASDVEACRTLLSVIGITEDLEEGSFDTDLVLDRLAFDTTSPVWSSLEGARENARTVREVISSEMWLCLNTTHNELPTQRSRARRGSPTTYFNFVKERAALVDAILARFVHGEVKQPSHEVSPQPLVLLDQLQEIIAAGAVSFLQALAA